MSDRGLFQEVLNDLEGIMIHLGHYDSENPYAAFWFCGHVEEYPDENDYDHFRYGEAAFKELLILLEIMQKSSPIGYVIFLTDYQFGPEKPEIQTLESMNDFVKLNEVGRIRFNTLYHINPSKESTTAVGS